MTATTDSSVSDWCAPDVLHVIAENHESWQDGLDVAVLQLQQTAANGDRRGILVTRRSRSLFTVEVSADVPFGTTMERDRWQRHVVPPAAGSGDEAGQIDFPSHP